MTANQEFGHPSSFGCSLQNSSRLNPRLESTGEAAAVRFLAHIQVTSAFPSSCSKPPSSRWDRALGYPPPNTGKPPMPPAVGDSSSEGMGLLTARLTERLDTSLCTDRAWRQDGAQRRALDSLFPNRLQAFDSELCFSGSKVTFCVRAY